MAFLNRAQTKSDQEQFPVLSQHNGTVVGIAERLKYVRLDFAAQGLRVQSSNDSVQLAHAVRLLGTSLLEQKPTSTLDPR
jgi:hypothetical protein